MARKRTTITLQFSVNLDLLPGWGHEVQDWIDLIQRDFLRQDAYKPATKLVAVTHEHNNNK
jgi:hypothetical protein